MHGIPEHSILASVNGECVLLLPFDAVLEKIDAMERPLSLKFLALPSDEGALARAQEPSVGPQWNQMDRVEEMPSELHANSDRNDFGEMGTAARLQGCSADSLVA